MKFKSTEEQLLYISKNLEMAIDALYDVVKVTAHITESEREQIELYLGRARRGLLYNETTDEE